MTAVGKTLLLSGATGFVGSALIHKFIESGWNVIGLARRRPSLSIAGVQWRIYDLAMPELPDDLFEGIDAFVHAAYVREVLHPSSETNISGSRKLVKLARERRIKKLFISSLAAHPLARSTYGKEKHHVEHMFTDEESAVVRAGLVLGSGGLCGKMAHYLARSNFVPIFGSGEQKIQTIYIDDLVESIFRICSRDLCGFFTIADPVGTPYKEFYRLLCEKLGTRPLFLPIPFWIAQCAVAVAQRLRISLPIDRDNLLGLKEMRFYDPTSSLERLGMELRSLSESLDLAVASCRGSYLP